MNTPFFQFSIFYTASPDHQVESASIDLLKAFKVSHKGFHYNGELTCWELRGEVLAIQYETLESEFKKLMKSMARSAVDIKPIY